jgi:ribosomal protein RSM22 (predicted rRNA methylase)
LPYDAAGGNSVGDLPAALRTALEAELDGYSIRELGRAADRLSDRYRADYSAAQPILGSPMESAAYLATRMPATYAAARQVLQRLTQTRPDFRPRTLLDLGAGTGACTWAAADAFPSLAASHLVDSSPAALATSVRMLGDSALRISHSAEGVERARWSSAGAFDLAVCGFLLGELEPDDQKTVITGMATTAPVIAVIEPGTPAGYRRVLAARRALIEAGRYVLAPCPHEHECPLEPTEDWCHFAVRLTRSIRHRQVKGGERGYEDEKYAYVVTATEAPAGRTGRILRHPQIRTGHVRMTVCDTDPGIEDMTVSKRHGADYRAARHAHWGDSWPPSSSP